MFCFLKNDFTCALGFFFQTQNFTPHTGSSDIGNSHPHSIVTHFALPPPTFMAKTTATRMEKRSSRAVHCGVAARVRAR